MLRLTLADVRLAALRVAVGGLPLALLLLLLGAGPWERTAAAAAGFAAWGLGPVTLVERVAGRRGLGPLKVALAAGAAAALFLPVALLQALAIGKEGGGPGLSSAVGVDDLLPCLLLGALAAPFVAGATYLAVVPSTRPVSPSPLARWVVEPLLAVAAMAGGLPLLAVYAIADALELLLVGPAPSMGRKLESLPDETPASPDR